MPTTNNAYRLRMITVVIFLCSTFFSLFSQETDSIDIQTLRSTLEIITPTEGREVNNLKEMEDFYEMEDLYDDLQIAEIYTLSDLKTLIKTYLEEVLSIEKEICRQIKENGNHPSNIHVRTGEYSVNSEDIRLIKNGIYFSTPGLIRTMIDLSQEEGETLEEL